MLSRQFRELVDLLRTLGGSIRLLNNSAENQERAINAASVSQQEACSRVERQIAEMRSDDEYKRGANTYKHKAYRQQIVLNCLTGLLAIFTLGAFAAAGIYACIAKKQLDQMIDATKQTKRAADIAAYALRENQRQFDLTSKSSQLQFDKTLEQIKGQTTAAQTAAVTAGKALSFNLNAAIAETGEPRIVVDPWVAWYYGSTWCKAAGQVCTRLTIHNITKETVVTDLQIAVKIAVLATTPTVYPNSNFVPVPKSRLEYSALQEKLDPGYPNCDGCSSYTAQQPLHRKAGTVYVWGTLRYRIFGGEVATSQFCFQATNEEIFGDAIADASGKYGFGNRDYSHTCPQKQTPAFPTN